ncbi:MAG: acyl-CoA desaturase [Acidobacteriota bacterium]
MLKLPLRPCVEFRPLTRIRGNLNQHISQSNKPGELTHHWKWWPRLNWTNSTLVVSLHLAGLFGFWYWPRPVDLALLLSLYLVSCLGIGLGYHRLLTHRGYKCQTWLRRMLTWAGAAALQGGPARWVATHRRHHQNVDSEGDPHSPAASFFYGHVGWVMCWNARDDEDQRPLAPDVSGDDVWMRVLDRGILFTLPWALSGIFCYVIAGWRGVLWGTVIRTLGLWHVTWCVNSVCHRWGRRPNETRDGSRNVWWVGLLSLGEGWHNNHHARPASALHGWHWYEIDISGYIIRLLARSGLIWNVVRVFHGNSSLSEQSPVTQLKADNGELAE